MGCCGGSGRNVHIKSQPIPVREHIRIKPLKTTRTIIQKSIKPHIVQKAKCPDCGYPTMVVNIGGRERQQCSNANCKKILKWLHKTS